MTSAALEWGPNVGQIINVLHCRVPEECPLAVAQLMRRCLSVNPKERPSAIDVVRIMACA